MLAPELCGSQLTEAMPGQYCLLGSQGVDLSCSYVSLPGMARRFTVTTHRTQALGQAGDVLDYSGPLGSAWPIPLHSTRLLAITRGEGILALLGCLDEILCWLPWVQVQLSHEGFPTISYPMIVSTGSRRCLPCPATAAADGRNLQIN